MVPANRVTRLTSGRFVKTGTMGTMASQAETGGWDHVPGTLQRESGDISEINEMVRAKSCNIVHFGQENASQCRP